jgi:hypothetical protein
MFESVHLRTFLSACHPEVFVLAHSGFEGSIAGGCRPITTGHYCVKTVYCPVDITYYDFHFI